MHPAECGSNDAGIPAGIHADPMPGGWPNVMARCLRKADRFNAEVSCDPGENAIAFNCRLIQGVVDSLDSGIDDGTKVKCVWETATVGVAMIAVAYCEKP
jgi:hypothetical protein